MTNRLITHNLRDQTGRFHILRGWFMAVHYRNDGRKITLVQDKAGQTWVLTNVKGLTVLWSIGKPYPADADTTPLPIVWPHDGMPGRMSGVGKMAMPKLPRKVKAAVALRGSKEYSLASKVVAVMDSGFPNVLIPCRYDYVNDQWVVVGDGWEQSGKNLAIYSLRTAELQTLRQPSEWKVVFALYGRWGANGQSFEDWAVAHGISKCIKCGRWGMFSGLLCSECKK